MENAAAPLNTFHLPPDINYACLQCGRGCELFDEVEADAETRARWETTDVERLLPSDVPKQAHIESPWTPGKRIMPKRDRQGAGHPCVFLRGDKLCSIHCEYGLETKPKVCRSFPYRFVETPAGVYAGVTFACTAVLQNHGPAVSSQEGELRETFAFTPSRSTAPEEIMLAPQLPITWTQYTAIEHDLSELMNAASDVGIGLVAQSGYLNLLSQFLHEARTEAGAEIGGAPEANETPLRVFRAGMSQPANGRAWDRILRIAEKPRNAAVLRRVCLGYALAVRKQHESRLGKFGAMASVMMSYFRHALGRGWIELPYGLGKVAYRSIENIRLDPTKPEHDELLRRFFVHCIFRKDLLLADDVKFGHSLMLMRYGLLQWISAALAVQAGRTEILMEDLTEALRIVEAQYGTHYSAFGLMFSGHPKLHDLMQSMFARPVFAFAMARS